MSKFHRGSGFRLLTSADFSALYDWVKAYVTSAIGALPPATPDGNGIYDGSGSVPEGTVASTEDATAANSGGVGVGEVWFNTTTSKYMVRLS